MRSLLAFTLLFLLSLALGMGLMVTRAELAEMRVTQNKVLLNEVDLTKIVYALNTRQMRVENILGDSEEINVAINNIHGFNAKINPNEVPPEGLQIGVGGGDVDEPAKRRSKPVKKHK
jgi:hypothetical protein